VIGLPVTCDVVGEIGCSISTGSRITGGGGFSDFFPMPSYQTEVVNYYLSNYGGSVPSQYYNSSGRAYPDISACGRNFLVYISGAWDPVDGTSAAAPTAAALLTIANDYRILNGLPVLGFVNPLLYQNVFSEGQYTQDYFNSYWDITMGINKYVHIHIF
jgi:tripeptidyl-peptidase I